MNMTKISVTKYAKLIAEQGGDEADAIMMLRVNDGQGQISILGLDEHMVSVDAIKMAITLKSLIDNELSMAVKLGETFQKIGAIKRKEASHHTVPLKPEEVPFCKSDEQPEKQQREEACASRDELDEKDKIREIANALIDAIFGGDDNEDDH